MQASSLPNQHSKLKFLLGCHLATNSFGLGRLFYKSSRQLQILGTMVTKMVATWRVANANTFMYECKSSSAGLKKGLVPMSFIILFNA